MVDLSTTIEPKSDQLNADDLITGPRTITVTKVAGTSDAQQPVAIHYEGDNGKPYKPCKSMRRVLVKLWGKEGDKYPGRSMTLALDPTVTYGGIAVGGVRISHMSDIPEKVAILLTVKRGKRAPVKILPLEQKPEKEAGSIESARVALEASNSETVGAIAAGLRDRKWTPAETKEIKRLMAEAKERAQ